MLSAKAEARPTAKECLMHDWFRIERPTLQESLLYNRRLAGKVSPPQKGAPAEN